MVFPQSLKLLEAYLAFPTHMLRLISLKIPESVPTGIQEHRAGMWQGCLRLNTSYSFELGDLSVTKV
jgi:hypothetical protein